MRLNKSFFVALLAALAVVAVPIGSAFATPGHSHRKCKQHKVAWVVKGTVVSSALTKNSDGTYDGTVEVAVGRQTSKHARSERNGTHTYTLDDARASFGVSDTANTPGTVDEADVEAGDRVKLIGKITTLPKKCDRSNFTATRTIRKAGFTDAPTQT